MRTCRILPLFCCVVMSAMSLLWAQGDSDHIQRSIDLINRGDLNGAEKEARRALLRPSDKPEALASLGMIRGRQKRFVEAIQFLKEAIELDPGLVDAYLALSEIYSTQKRYEEALHEISVALSKSPGNHAALFAMAQLEEKKGNFDASLETLEPISSELRKSASGILLLAQDFANLKQKDALAALASDWDALSAPPVEASIEFADLLEKASLEQAALNVLEKAKTSGAVSTNLALELANLYFAKGDLNQAFESYESARALSPECIQCLRQLAAIAAQQKDPEKALAYLIMAKRLKPIDPDVLFEFGKTCLEMDLLGDALPALQQAAQLRPDNDHYAYVLGSAYVSQKQYAMAAKIYQELLQKHPRDSVLNYTMGSLLFLQVKLDEAAVYLRKSIELQPDQDAAYYYLGLVAEGKGQDGEAVMLLREVVGRDPDYGPAYEALGRILLKQEKYDQAKDALEKAIALNPDSVKAHYQLGMLLGRMGRQDEATKELAIVQQLNEAESKKEGMRLRILSAH
jgi:tetratricopeptide (TPR) repeat protein